MRSFAARAALAAVLASTTLTGAFAANMQYPAQPQKSEQTSTMKTAAAPATIAAPIYKPRLAHVMNEIRAADRRMALDHKRGYLNVAEFRTLEGRSSAIRDSAIRVAKVHDGTLPNPNYQNLLRRISLLNHSIHAYASNRA